MSEPIAKQKKDDPLQRFMVFAAVALLVMMAIEEFHIHRVNSASENLHTLSQELVKAKGCKATSTGLNGATWVFDCPGQSAELTANWLEPLVVSDAGFDRVLIGDRTHFLICTAETRGWGTQTCETALRPSHVIDGEKAP
jgi:hypothetical protein